MKIKLNGIFFSIIFLAALLAEMYCLLVLEADLFTISGLGIVILISLYLLLDSIRGQWKQSKEKTLFYLEHLYRDEAEKRDVRHTELLNLQKASYTAAKKNAARLEERVEELMLRLQSMEKSNSEALHKVNELQKKLMDGQKNALNIEVNYHKENTKALITAIREEAEKLNQEEKLERILDALKDLQGLKAQVETKDIPLQQYVEDSFTEEWIDEPVLSEMGFTEEESTEDSIEDWIENSIEDEQQPEELIEAAEEKTSAPEVVPLYDDPNKSLTREEIAALFASYGK